MKKAILWNFISQLGGAGVQFLTTVIMARLLNPDDFGVVGMCTIFIAVSNMIVDSEMGGALLRKKMVSKVDYSTLFFYNIVVSVVLYLILFFLAPLVAFLYDKNVLITAIRVLSLSVIIQSFRIVQRIILFRELKFHTMAVINVISGLSSLFLAIYLAKKGYGYWSLIIQQVSMSAVSAIMLACVTRFIPCLSFSKLSFKYQFRFGINLLGADLLKIVSTNISSNIVARYTSLHITGLFVQSSRLSNYGVTFISSILDQTIYPFISKMKNQDEVTNFYLKYFVVVVELTCFVNLLLFVLSKEFIYVLLGSKWIDATPYFALLSFIILPSVIQVCIRILLKANACTNGVFNVQVLKSVLIIVCIFVGLLKGIVGLVVGCVVAEAIVAVVMMLLPSLNIRFLTQLKPVLKCVFIMLLILSCTMFFESLFESFNVGLKMIIVSLSYLGLCYCFDELHFIDALRKKTK